MFKLLYAFLWDEDKGRQGLRAITLGLAGVLGTAAGSAIIEGDLAKVTPEQWARAAIVGTLSALGGGIAVGQRNEPKP